MRRYKLSYLRSEQSQAVNLDLRPFSEITLRRRSLLSHKPKTMREAVQDTFYFPFGLSLDE